MRKLIMITLVCLVVFSGCSKKKTYEIQLKQTEIEVNSSLTGCELVAAVNDQQIKSSMLSDNQIITDDFIIDCPKLYTNRLGDLEVEYSIGKKIYTYKLTITDTIAPIIEIDKDYYEVEEGNEYFDINKEYKVTDNSNKDLLITVNGEYDLNTVGVYEVEILAIDESGNKQTKKITIDVIEKEKEIIEVPGKTPGGSSNGNTGNSNNNSSNSEINNSGGSSNGNSGGTSDGGNSGGNTSSPYLNVPSSVSVSVGSSVDALFNKLGNVADFSGALTITASEVNLSVAGTYTAYYSTSDGLSASISVIVE